MVASQVSISKHRLDKHTVATDIIEKLLRREISINRELKISCILDNDTKGKLYDRGISSQTASRSSGLAAGRSALPGLGSCVHASRSPSIR